MTVFYKFFTNNNKIICKITDIILLYYIIL